MIYICTIFHVHTLLVKRIKSQKMDSHVTFSLPMLITYVYRVY